VITGKDEKLQTKNLASLSGGATFPPASLNFFLTGREKI